MLRLKSLWLFKPEKTHRPHIGSGGKQAEKAVRPWGRLTPVLTSHMTMKDSGHRTCTQSRVIPWARGSFQGVKIRIDLKNFPYCHRQGPSQQGFIIAVNQWLPRDSHAPPSCMRVITVLTPPQLHCHIVCECVCVCVYVCVVTGVGRR